MSDFKRKVNIIESTTPPTNPFDWWYDLNNGVLKKPVGGGYIHVLPSIPDGPTPSEKSDLNIGTEGEYEFYIYAYDGMSMLDLLNPIEGDWEHEFDGSRNRYTYTGSDTDAFDEKIMSSLSALNIDNGVSDVLVVLPPSIKQISPWLGNMIPSGKISGVNIHLVCPSVEAFEGNYVSNTDHSYYIYLGNSQVVNIQSEFPYIDENMEERAFIECIIPDYLKVEYNADNVWIESNIELKTMAEDTTLDNIVYSIFGEL